MATNTANVNLYKADPATDGSSNFNIVTLLNENWDKLDDYCKDLLDSIAAHKASNDHDGRYFTETELSAVTDSASGADRIGATAVSSYSGATVQAILEAIGAALVTHKTSGDHDGRYFTETELSAVTDSAAGADRIGATAISGLTGGTVQALLEALKAFIDTDIAALATHKTSGDHDGRYFTETELGATTDSAAGADRIGATTVSGYVGTSVQAILEAIGAALVTHKASTDHDGRYFTETELSAVTDGTAGADRIGATGISGLTGNTVQALLEALKTYIDSVEQGLDPKDSVRVATTANITLSGLQAIDSATVIAGDRVLVKNQTTQSENGIYVVAAGAWTRATDADTAAKLTAGAYTFVEEGTTNADSGWVMTQNGAITIGTTAITWAQFSGAGQITANGGLTKSGNTISIATDGVTAAMLAAGAADDTAIGNRTVTDTTAPAADAAALTTLLSNIGYMLKAITGKTSWRTAPATTLDAASAHAAAASPHSGHVLTSDVVAIAAANKLLKLDASGLLPASITGNAATANKLAAARTISLTGDITGSVSFDGSANASITAVVADDSHNHIIANIDGLQAILDGKADDTEFTQSLVQNGWAKHKGLIIQWGSITVTTSGMAWTYPIAFPNAVLSVQITVNQNLPTATIAAVTPLTNNVNFISNVQVNAMAFAVGY